MYGLGTHSVRATEGRLAIAHAAPAPLRKIEADLRVQPLVPVAKGLEIEPFSRVVPVDRRVLRGGCVQRLRVGRGHEVVDQPLCSNNGTERPALLAVS